MTISLQKGGKLSLAKAAPAMRKALIGLGWKEQTAGGPDFDLDASVFMLSAIGKCKNEKQFVFYGQMNSLDGSINHEGDERTGGNEGDDERIHADLERVPLDVEELSVVVTIHDAAVRRQNFGMVDKAYIRIVDAETQAEVARYDLTEDFSTEDAVIVASLSRVRGGWEFKAIGEGHSRGLAGLRACAPSMVSKLNSPRVRSRYPRSSSYKSVHALLSGPGQIDTSRNNKEPKGAHK